MDLTHVDKGSWHEGKWMNNAQAWKKKAKDHKLSRRWVKEGSMGWKTDTQRGLNEWRKRRNEMWPERGRSETRITTAGCTSQVEGAKGKNEKQCIKESERRREGNREGKFMPPLCVSLTTHPQLPQVVSPASPASFISPGRFRIFFSWCWCFYAITQHYKSVFLTFFVSSLMGLWWLECDMMFGYVLVTACADYRHITRYRTVTVNVYAL